MYFVYILYCSFTRLHVSSRACSLTNVNSELFAIDRRRRNVKVQHIGANYDPMKPGKMDDLVSRVISVSMDLYFYYIPITLG